MKVFETVSNVGMLVIVVSALAMVASIAVGFVFTSAFTMGLQVAAHIVTIVAAGTLKVGYVAYIAGRHERGLAI